MLAHTPTAPASWRAGALFGPYGPHPRGRGMDKRAGLRKGIQEKEDETDGRLLDRCMV